MTFKTPVRKRSVIVSGHPTSISVENEFWNILKETAKGRNQSVSELISNLDSNRSGNLSSTIRIFVLNELLDKNSTK